VHDWLPHLEAAVIAGGQDPTHVQAQATLALAIVRGLLLDQKATGEVTRAQRLGSRGQLRLTDPLETQDVSVDRTLHRGDR